MTAPHHPPQALFGGALCGDRIVRLVYMDEAGLSNPDHEPIVVEAAVIVDADRQLVAIERHLDKLVARLIPEEHRAKFVFHATEIFNGGGKVFRRNDPEWPRERRWEIGDALAGIAGRFRLPVAIGFTKRDAQEVQQIVEHTETRKPVVAAHLMAFMNCAMSVEHWMRQQASGEVCLLIVEDNDQARAVIREQLVAHQNPEMVESMTANQRRHFPFRRIKQDPLFEPKRPRSVLQVADFCAYVVKRVLSDRAEPDWRERFFEPIRPQVVTFEPGQFS